MGTVFCPGHPGKWGVFRMECKTTGMSALRSDIPPRLRRGVEKHKEVTIWLPNLQVVNELPDAAAS